MAKKISQLNSGPVKQLLEDIWDNKEFQTLIQDDNIAGPSGVSYMLAWKIQEQQKQIAELTKRLDQVTRYVANGSEGED